MSSKWSKYSALMKDCKKWTLSWQRSLSYRNQSIDLLCKSMDCFLYDRDLLHERVKQDPTSSLTPNPNHRCIQNPVKHLRCRLLGKKVTASSLNHFCEKLHFRWLTGFWLHLFQLILQNSEIIGNSWTCSMNKSGLILALRRFRNFRNLFNANSMQFTSCTNFSIWSVPVRFFKSNPKWLNWWW